MFDEIDVLRQQVSSQLALEQKAALGQYMTPSAIARYMVSMFEAPTGRHIRVLDAGAGIGSLTAAFLDHLQRSWPNVNSTQVTAYEIDAGLALLLRSTLNSYANHGSSGRLSAQVREADFIEAAVGLLGSGQGNAFDFAVLNPPYKKIGAGSAHRLLLRQVGIETVNLYSAFVALALRLLKAGGQLVAIVPRSFCNGPYYRLFRQEIFQEAALRQVHLFDSRSKPFGNEAILQENVILHLIKARPAGQVKVSVSEDETLGDLKSGIFAFEDLVSPEDAERIIHIPAYPQGERLSLPVAFSHSLSCLGLSVSTGPVVDFRVKPWLRSQPGPGCVPLLYPAHFAEKYMSWPKVGFKKANAMEAANGLYKWFYPAGFYTLVKRFSSKEEKKRIVARVVDPQRLQGYEHYGFENHLNVFHCGRQGLSHELALGLAVYLNSSLVDAYFRQFNGHTQVNATDLRQLTYPDRETLLKMGSWMSRRQDFDQQAIDEQIACFAGCTFL